MIEERLTKRIVNETEVEFMEKVRIENGKEIPCESFEKENELRATDQYKRMKGLLTSNQVKNIRTAIDKTQEEFSELLGVGRSQIGKMEKGSIQSKSIDMLIRNFYKCYMIESNLKFFEGLVEEMYSWEFNYNMASKFVKVIDKYKEFKNENKI